MGYYISSTGCNFSMKKNKAPEALKALKQLFSSDFHAGWVRNKEVVNAKTFEEALRAARFSVWGSHDSDEYSKISFEGEKYSGDEMTTLEAIAPFVKKGSYIEMLGEEGEHFRWVFNGKKMQEQQAKIVWE